jgi:hypothetical protein
MPTNTRGGAKGGDQDFKTQDVRGVREDKGVVIGVVKVNSHPTRSGTMMVFVPTFSDQAREEDKTQWRSVKYATPFYSRTSQTNSNGKTIDATGDTVEAVKNTSGFVFPAPDVGSRVLCVFPEGRNADGYYFACAPDVYMIQSLPESSASKNFTKNPNLVRHDKAPTLEFNDTDNDVGKITNFLTPKRALDTHTAGFLKAQGLDQDEIRGLTSSSYTRETPSEVIGISTKGRRLLPGGQKIESKPSINKALNEGGTLSEIDAKGVEARHARAKGHALVMDDGDIEGNNSLMRFRTAAGHQILLHDTEDLIYIANSKGTSWIQIDGQGQLDIYSQTNINLRSRNINMHADQNIKMHAGQTVQIVAGANLHLEGTSMANLYSDKGATFIHGGSAVHVKSGGGVNIQASSGMNLKAGATIAIQGSCVALQSSAAGAGKQKKAVQLTLEDTTPDTKGFYNSGKELPTTVDRVPTHEPYKSHNVATPPSVYEAANIDDIKSGADLTPAIPKGKEKLGKTGIERALANTNDKLIPALSIVQQNAAGIAMGNLNSKVTRNLAAGVTNLAGSGGMSNFVNSVTGAVGKFGATVENLQKNGFVRPEALFNGQLTDSKLWTGKDGISSVSNFLSNDFTQENMFYADTFNSMQDAYNSGAIDEFDDEDTIAGMTLVTYASGDAGIAADYRQGNYIDPRPLAGTTIVPDNNDMTSYYDDYFHTGVAASKQSSTEDGLGYSSGWYENISGDDSATGARTVVTRDPGKNETTTKVTTSGGTTTQTIKTVSGGGSITRTADAASRARDEAQLASERIADENRRKQIARIKAETGLSGSALLKEVRRRENNGTL